MTVPRKKITREKIFDFEIFGLKFALKHSESFRPKKIFRPEFLDVVIFHYFGPLGQKTVESEQWYTGKIFDFEIFVLKYVLKYSESILKEKFFWPKIFIFWSFFVKNEGFWPFSNFLGRNQKNVFCNSFAQFYYGHFGLFFGSLRLKM